MSKAYREVYEILKYIPTSEKKKISSDLLKTIEKNMDMEYEFKITDIKNFEKQEVLPETKALLAVLYRDCWATPAEKSSILEKEKQEIQAYKIEQEKKNDLENLLVRTKNNRQEEATTSMVTTSNESSLISRLLLKIKAIFRK